MCRRMECQIGYKEEKLAFMAIGALLGVKILRRNAEHVVTLNANTMKHRLPRRRRFVFRSMSLSLGLSGVGCHNQILAYRRLSRHLCYACAWALRHPDQREPHLKGRSRSHSIRRRPVVCRLKLCYNAKF
jgi:hypothetical protein